MRHLIVVFLLSNTFNSCSQISDKARNKIVFIDEIAQVADSIVYLESILKKLPKHAICGSFIDDKGYLYVNTNKIGLLSNALLDPTIRTNPVFKNFNSSDYDKFVVYTIFLYKNHIDASIIDNQTGFFTHEYRKTNEYTYSDLRYVMVNTDTTSKLFLEHYQILDSKENMILVAPIDVNVR